jgi:hypothetical protein
LLCASPSFADLIYVSTVDLTGTGLGAVATILTQQDRGGGPQDHNISGVSSGCVAPGGTTDTLGPEACLALFGVTGGEEKTGANQTLTRSLVDPDIVSIGINSLANLGIVYNSSNQGNNEEVTLNQLALTIWNGTDLVYFATIEQPQTLKGFTGTGSSGFMFALDSTQLFLASVLISPYLYSDLRIGLNATVSNDHGGNETFFVHYYDRVSSDPVPEPATSALAGSAALACAAWYRIRNRQS